MAASISRDLRLELEQMMNTQMRLMFAGLEERLTRAVAEGRAINNEHAPDLPRAASGEKRKLQESGNKAFASNGGYECLVMKEQKIGESLSARGPPSARDIKYSVLPFVEEPDEQAQAAEITRKFRLNCVTLLMLAINACVDAFQVDYQARQNTNEIPRLVQTLQVSLCIGFALELASRVQHQGWYFFSTHRGLVQYWHIFQALLVASQVMETTMTVSAWCGVVVMSTRLRHWFRTISVTRVLRVFHVLDHLDCTTELHLLLASMSGSLMSLGWSALFMMVPMFVFSMGLTQVVREFRVESGLDVSAMSDLMTWYGTLDRSCLTLFYSIAGGLSWSEAQMPLMQHGLVGSSFLFLVYVALMTFVVLNVLTGVFVQAADAAASSENEKKVLETLHKIFHDVDYDRSGTLTNDEFNALLEHKDIGVCLQSLNIPPNQADHLFKLIDSDGSGAIAIDEFLDGCNKFQGSLKALDFATFTSDFQNLKIEVQDFMRQMNQTQMAKPAAPDGSKSSRDLSSSRSWNPFTQVCTPTTGSSKLSD